MRHCILIAFASALLLVAGNVQAETVYDADFSQSGIGSTHDTKGDGFEASPITGPNWTMSWPSNPASDSSTNSFITQNNTVFIDDWGGTGVLTSDTIDVSLYDMVDIAGVAATHGTDVFNNQPTEYFEWFYSIDSGGEVKRHFTSDGSLNHTFTGIDVSGANTLVVGFRFNVNGANNGAIVSSMTVSGEPTAIPEPSTLALLGILGLMGLVWKRNTKKNVTA